MKDKCMGCGCDVDRKECWELEDEKGRITILCTECADKLLE